MKSLREWIQDQIKNPPTDVRITRDFDEGYMSGWEAANRAALNELKAREDATETASPPFRSHAEEIAHAQDASDITPSNPGRFTKRIVDLRRDLSVAGDAEERSKISQELLDAEDQHQEDVGEDMARDRHAKAMRQRGPKGGYPRETWGDDDS